MFKLFLRLTDLSHLNSTLGFRMLFVFLTLRQISLYFKFLSLYSNFKNTSYSMLAFWMHMCELLQVFTIFALSAPAQKLSCMFILYLSTYMTFFLCYVSVDLHWWFVYIRSMNEYKRTVYKCRQTRRRNMKRGLFLTCWFCDNMFESVVVVYLVLFIISLKVLWSETNRRLRFLVIFLL